MPCNSTFQNNTKTSYVMTILSLRFIPMSYILQTQRATSVPERKINTGTMCAVTHLI